MYIYIDESGIFRNPANRDNIASCVSALVIPSSHRRTLFKKFKRLLSKWPPPANGREIKGSELNEAQIAQVVSLLQRYEVVLETVSIDLGLHTEQEITDFKTMQADKLVADLTAEHQPSLIEQAHEQRVYILRMSNQLFVQAFLMWLLIPRFFQKLLLYYSVRIPRELGQFHWVIDAKDKQVTEFERSWSTVIYPVIYSHSLKEPLRMVEGGDYSYFEKYRDDDEERLKAIREENDLDDDFDMLSTKKIFGDNLSFDSSYGNLGLQLVDILVNATQRALNGRLQQTGWENIGTLMLAQKHGPVRLIKFNVDGDELESRTFRTPFLNVLTVFKRTAKAIL